MEYKLCDDPWNWEEINAINSVVKNGMYTMSEEVFNFEEQFAAKVGSKYAVMVSSGSSANLLGIASLVYSGRLPRGSEVIVPAVSWSTTYSPLEQFGMKIVFVDIDKDTLNIDLDKVRNAITDNTKMVFAVNLLGNPNEYKELMKICEEADILLAEDNCESLGGKYNDKYLGTFGMFGSFSFFYSHHICTMEGGMAITNDKELYEYMLAIRAHGWTRNLPDNSMIHKIKMDPFYESFNFVVPGFNLRPLEMEGAIGLKQIEKMDQMIKNRRKNAEHFCRAMEDIPFARTQKEVGESSWFGFSIVLSDNMVGRRREIVNKLLKAGIECRPIVAGNFTRQEAVKYMDYKISGSLENADEIHEQGFFIGNHSSIIYDKIDFFKSILQEL